MHRKRTPDDGVISIHVTLTAAEKTAYAVHRVRQKWATVFKITLKVRKLGLYRFQ